MLVNIKKLFSDKRGVTAVEYGLIAALVALGIVAAVSTMATNLGTTFSSIATHLSSTSSGSGSGSGSGS